MIPKNVYMYIEQLGYKQGWNLGCLRIPRNTIKGTG